MKKHTMTIIKVVLVAIVVGYIAWFVYSNASYQIDPPGAIAPAVENTK